MRVVNLEILANPLNWFTLAVWLLALSVIAHVLGVLPDNMLVMENERR